MAILFNQRLQFKHRCAVLLGSRGDHSDVYSHLTRKSIPAVGTAFRYSGIRGSLEHLDRGAFKGKSYSLLSHSAAAGEVYTSKHLKRT